MKMYPQYITIYNYYTDRLVSSENGFAPRVLPEIRRNRPVIRLCVYWVVLILGAFFYNAPFMVRTYGKIRGASLNYGFSWVSMIAIILGLEFGMGDGSIYKYLGFDAS